jgi:hypothetical protein
VRSFRVLACQMAFSRRAHAATLKAFEPRVVPGKLAVDYRPR